MAMTLKYNPDAKYISANEDIVFILLEDTKPFDTNTYPDYKYVCDIYVGVDLVARIKAFPRPGDKIGVFNIGNIVRSYLNQQFNCPPNLIRVNQFGSGTFYVNITCRFGEEYNFATYPNILVDSQRSYFNHYNDRQFGTRTILPNFLDKVLTTRPYAQSINRNADSCYVPFMASDDTTIQLQVKCYNKSLGFLRQVNYNITPTAVSTDEVQQFNLAPKNINAVTPGTIDGLTDYYIVRFDTTNIIDDSELRFDITCESKYEPFYIHFMNQFGCFETKEFSKVSRTTIEYEKTSYGNPNYYIQPGGDQVDWFNLTNKVQFNQKPVYAATWSEKMQLNTDILTDEEYRWLKQLVVSTDIHLQINDYKYPILITDTNYEPRKIINDRLTNLTLNVQFAEHFNAQFR